MLLRKCVGLCFEAAFDFELRRKELMRHKPLRRLLDLACFELISGFELLKRNEKRFSWDPNRVAKVQVLGMAPKLNPRREYIANYIVVQSPTREKRRKTSNKKVEKRAGIVSRLQDSLDHILVGVESKVATKEDDPCSIENCIKLLCKLPGLEPYSPQFYLGIRLMAKPQYRKTFMH
ncbi:hypothetical protein Ahy_B01g055644 [Arachis hypogaea]|uniref:Uncharacterized protein n=1 Tax=Arachis hypogaea TaxID=3818 RepID=A0A445AWQ3_ARAHY|nr:hypothetical protein Ahy_B01g055644 [Arachis hypogaea]